MSPSLGNYRTALLMLGVALVFDWFGDPGPNPFYAGMVFWCFLTLSVLFGLIGLLFEPWCISAIDRLEARWNRANRPDRSGDA